MAYERYHNLMRDIAERYATPLPRVIAAFCTLSPNNDYMGNLRSLISVLDGIRAGAALDDIQISTYRHCMLRAHAYLTGARDFEHMTKGLKVLNFYHNVLDPSDQRWVTIDGHMVATWRGKKLTMKEALLRRRSEYHLIADAVKRLAFAQFMLPQQYQAVIWFARKRTLRIKYNAQTDIFYQGDVWQTFKRLDDIRPFPRRPAK